MDLLGDKDPQQGQSLFNDIAEERKQAEARALATGVAAADLGFLRRCRRRVQLTLAWAVVAVAVAVAWWLAPPGPHFTASATYQTVLLVLFVLVAQLFAVLTVRTK